mgnify:CR=1 FL=1
MKVWQKNLILIVLVVLLAAFGFNINTRERYAEADGTEGITEVEADRSLHIRPSGEITYRSGQAEEVILELQPDYEPWFEPILEPASGEVESLLFALQAAIGAGVVGFVLGRITKKPEKREQG